MSKLATRPPQRPRTFIAGLDPVELSQFLDRHFDGSRSNYWTLYNDVRALFLEHEGETTVKVAELLTALDDCLVEAAFRQAGFVIGFEVCRQLILGEIDLETLQKDEHESEDDTPEGGAQ
jgi:hypothetical protein